MQRPTASIERILLFYLRRRASWWDDVVYTDEARYRPRYRVRFSNRLDQVGQVFAVAAFL
jgi:hypothetical protein